MNFSEMGFLLPLWILGSGFVLGVVSLVTMPKSVSPPISSARPMAL